MGKAYDAYMPSADDFIMLILGIAYSLYDGKYAPAAKTYDAFRGGEWPASRPLLRSLGYLQNPAGWSEFIGVMIELPIVTGSEASRIYNERKAHVVQKTAVRFQDPNLAIHYEWPWNGERERIA